MSVASQAQAHIVSYSNKVCSMCEPERLNKREALCVLSRRGVEATPGSAVPPPPPQQLAQNLLVPVQSPPWGVW